MLVCQKYGGVAEIRTRASLATPNDLAKAELAVTAILTVTIQPDLAFFMPFLLLFVNIFQSFLMCFRLLATFLATQCHVHLNKQKQQTRYTFS